MGESDSSTARCVVSVKATRKRRVGAIPNDVSGLKGALTAWLTKFPRLFLLIEKYRRWISWDRRVYLFFVAKGDKVADVGANSGAHAVIFSNLVGRKGRVFAFEPMQENLARLRESLRLRARNDNVEIHDAALGHPSTAESKVTIYIPGTDLTQASLGRHATGSWVGEKGAPPVQSETCRLTSLDAAIGASVSGGIDFLKIDVEGAELGVLEGARQILERKLPLVYCEIFSGWTAAFGYAPADLMAFLYSLGYCGVRVFDEDRIIPLDLSGPIPADLFERSVNALFFDQRHEAQVHAFDEIFRSYIVNPL